MGIPAVGSERHSRGRRPSALRAAVGLDAVAVVLLVYVVLHVRARSGDSGPAETFFSDPAPAVALLASGAAAVGAGAVAAASLARARLASRAGRWATRLALANALALPVVGGGIAAVASLTGSELSEGWGEPIVPVAAAAGLAAAVLGLVAKEPGRRGLLVVPFMIGAFVLVFAIGELVAPH